MIWISWESENVFQWGPGGAAKIRGDPPEIRGVPAPGVPSPTRPPPFPTPQLCMNVEARLHEHQVPNPDPNLDHNLHGRGGLSLDLNPVCLCVNATNLDQNPRVDGVWINSAMHTLIGQ